MTDSWAIPVATGISLDRDVCAGCAWGLAGAQELATRTVSTIYG